MLACAATSIIAGIFDIKHYLHLQLVPHISSHHQVCLNPSAHPFRLNLNQSSSFC